VFPLTDEYYICLTSDDGSKLFIEDSLVISNDGIHSAVQECVVYASSAGVKHIEVEYFQRGGGAILTLQYVPLSRPPWFRLMRIINPSEFVPKPDNITEVPSASPTELVGDPTVSPESDPSASPSNVPTLVTSAVPTVTPSSDPSTDTSESSASPSVQSFGKVRARYYEALGWTSLPSSGFSSLSAYKSEKVETINFSATNGNFAGSGRNDNVAALFTGTIQVPIPTSPWTLEAEDAEISSGVQIEDLHTGFFGTSFADFISSGAEAYIEWGLDVESLQAGYYDIKIRYALGKIDSRPLKLSINGIDETLEFPTTGSWSKWEYTESIRVYLESGSNIIRASATGSSGANIDHLRIDVAPSTIGFCITSDDGSKLKINGEIAILNDGLHGAVRECSSVEVTDPYIDIMVEYFERGGDSVMILEYSPAGTEEYFVVPADVWI